MRRRPILVLAAALACACKGGSSEGETETDASETTEASATTDTETTTEGSDSDADTGTDTDTGSDTGENLDPNWPMFGHDHDNTRHNAAEDVLTADTVASLALLWEHVGAEVTSTPAVVDGVVYFADWSGQLYAKSAADGAEVWTIQLAPEGVPITCSPLVTEDRVYIGDMAANFYAVERETGAVAWSALFDAHEDANFTGSAVLIGDLLVVGVASGELGKALDDYTFRGSVLGIDADTGDERWRVWTTEDDESSGAGVSVWSSPAVDATRGLVYIGTGNAYEEPGSDRSDAILAIDYASGAIAWVAQFTEGDVYTILQPPPQGPDADIGAAPNLFTLADGTAVVGVGDKAGVYAAVDRDTGDPIWSVVLTQGSHLGGVMTAAAYADGVIYTASNLWPGGFNTENPFFPDFEDPENTSVMFALDAEDGGVLWQTDLPSPTLGAIAVAGGVVYSGATDGTLRAFDAESGEVLWSDVPGNPMASGQSVAGGLLLSGHGFAFIGITGGSPGEEGGLVVYGPEG